MALSTQTLNELRAELNASLAPAHTETMALVATAAAPGAAAAAAPAVPADFCSLYKSVRPILQGAVSFLPFLPGLGSSIATAIKLLMKIADPICPYSTGLGAPGVSRTQTGRVTDWRRVRLTPPGAYTNCGMPIRR